MGKDRSARLGTAAAYALSLVTGISISVCAAAAPPATGDKGSPPDSERARLILHNATVVTMDDALPQAQAIAVDAAGKIMKVGNNFQIDLLKGDSTQVVDATGMTILPGFIDPHSHMAGYGMYNDPEHWIDVSAINVYFKPPPGTAGCKTPLDPQYCFIPVRTQADVVARIRAELKRVTAVGRQSTLEPQVLAFNYDPSRLGHDPGCAAGDVSYECTTFENGNALQQLDAISKDVPIYVTSESGHISYVNSIALDMLRICGTMGHTRENGGCHPPTINSDVETALANKGQLDEDLSLYATGHFQGKVLKAVPGLGPALLQKAAEIYAQHGYTLAQEGAAGVGDMHLYEAATKDCQRPTCQFPLTAAIVAYDNDSDKFWRTIAAGDAGKAMFANNPLVFVAALKTFADGSPQGYTAYLKQPYSQFFAPFNDTSIFPQQPYRGLPDIERPELEARLRAAHAAGYPMIIHQIGDAAIGTVVEAVVATKDVPPPAGKRDVMLHAAMITDTDLDVLKGLGTAVVSIMSSNVYFFGLPECNMVLGPQRAINFYPAKSVADRGLHLTLHSDSPVMPPDPLFETWVAVTRNIQQPAWYPNTDPQRCPTVFANNPAVPGDQRITILDAIKGFTTNAAYQYGLTDRGSLQPGYVADMVVLSANPLASGVVTNPDQLKTIRTIGTVSAGQYFPNPNANAPPVWPGD